MKKAHWLMGLRRVLGGSEWVSAHPTSQTLGAVADAVVLLNKMLGFDSWYGK